MCGAPALSSVITRLPVVAAGLLAGALIVAACGPAYPELPPVPDDAPRVLLETSEGNILIGLYPERAPQTVDNFLAYVDAGFYEGTIFHRVMPDFMIQGGGFTEAMERKPTRPPIPLETHEELKNLRGSVAMARLSVPDTATSQFFINLVDNPGLDALPPVEYGYTVFGVVLEGMDVVDRIAQVDTGSRRDASGGSHGDVPTEPIVVRSARRVASE